MELKIVTSKHLRRPVQQLLDEEYAFFTPFIDLFKKMPSSKSIYFPKTEGGLREGELSIELGLREHYNIASITVLCPRLGMKQAYRAEVSIAFNGGYQLAMQMGIKHSPRLFPRIVKQYPDPQKVIDAIVANFSAGATFRKIVHLPSPT